MQNEKGFTLLELTVACAILAILAAIAIPSYIGWLPKRHLRSSAVDVQAAIQLAKMTAIRENTDVVLTFDPSNNSYLVFIDNDYDNVVELTDENGTQNAGEPTIRSKEMSPGIDLVSTGFPADTITLNSRGLEGNNNSGSITLRNNLGQNTIVTVTVTGMSRIN